MSHLSSSLNLNFEAPSCGMSLGRVERYTKSKDPVLYDDRSCNLPQTFKQMSI